jgi:acyl carrier protein
MSDDKTGDETGKSKSTLLNQIALQLNDAEDILNVIQAQARKAPPTVKEATAAFVAPRTSVEKTLAEIWSRALNVEPIGVHQNFFHLGGTSLLATQLLSDVYDAFQVELTLKELFDDAPTIAGLAQAIERRQIEQASMTDIVANLEELEKLSDESAGRMLGEEERLKQD